MQAKRTLVFVLLVLAAVSGIAKGESNSCRTWKEMQTPAQLAYVTGFIDGLVAGAPPERLHERAKGSQEGEDPYTLPGLTLGTLQDGITAICKRPENSLIVIMAAWEAFAMQVRGKPQSEIDDYLNIARQAAIKNQGSDKPNHEPAPRK